MSVDFDYDAGITEMPIFDDFMSTTFSSKQSMIDYVYDCLCDSIGGIIHRPVLQFWYGGGRNGKIHPLELHDETAGALHHQDQFLGAAGPD